MFDFSNATFNGPVQANTGNGVQNNNCISNSDVEEINNICDTLRVISEENESIKNTIAEIQSEISRGASKSKIFSLLGTLKNAITVASVASKFPDIVEKVKGMISNIIH